MTAPFQRQRNSYTRTSSTWTDFAAATGAALVPTTVTTPSLTAFLWTDSELKTVAVTNTHLKPLIKAGLVWNSAESVTINLLDGRIHVTMKSGKHASSENRLICVQILEHLISDLIQGLPKNFKFPKICGSSGSSGSKQALVEEYSKTRLTNHDLTDYVWEKKREELYLALLGAIQLRTRTGAAPLSTTVALTPYLCADAKDKTVAVRGTRLVEPLITLGLVDDYADLVRIDLLDGCLHTTKKAGFHLSSNDPSNDPLICARILRYLISDQIEALPNILKFPKTCRYPKSIFDLLKSYSNTKPEGAFLEEYSETPLTDVGLISDKWGEERQQLFLTLVGAIELHKPAPYRLLLR